MVHIYIYIYGAGAFTAERPIFSAAQAVPPPSGDYLDTINRALGIIALQSRLLTAPLPPRTISLDSMLPSSECAVETPLVDPVSQPPDDAPIIATEDAPTTLELTTLEDSCTHEKDISLPRAATTGTAIESFFIGDTPPQVPEDATAAYIAILEERLTRAIAQLDADHDLIILGNIQIEKRVSVLEFDISGPGSAVFAEEEALASEDGANEEQREPFTAAQLSEINRIFTNTFAGFIDQIIAKVQNMITTELQTSFDPVCSDLRNQIEMLRNEIVFKLTPVQSSMKRYCFKHKSDNLHEQNEQNFNRSSDNQSGIPPSSCGRLHDLHVPNLDIVHIDDEPNLVRYFEKLVDDEVSSCNSMHDLHGNNLMQPPQIDIGETLQDCIDFDELLHDIHSTAASAQLLQRSLSGSSEPPF